MVLPRLDVPGDVARDLDAGTRREWLEHDGLGGFAMGTVAGPATRRYHALLCVATRPPVGRMVLVNRLDETLVGDDGVWSLSANCYADAVHPRGHEHLIAFRLDPWPVWTYRLGTRVVERAVIMTSGRQLTLVRWRLLEGPGAQLYCKPLMSGRDYHALHRHNEALRGDVRAAGPGWARVQTYDGVPAVTLCFDGELRAKPEWYFGFEYAAERARGLPSTEDLFSPGELCLALEPGEDVDLVLSAEAAPLPAAEVDVLLADERARRAAVVGDTVGWTAQLTLAADRFLARRGGHRTILAGYPWFTDWGRDAFISLGGLGPCDGALERDVLLAFRPYVDGGLVPNRFVDANEAPEYNAVDAPLWYVLAACRHARRDPASLAWVEAEMLPVLSQILDAFLAGTRFHIGVDDDGLLHAAEPGLQLTWMDAKVGEWVVTPRMGRPVEIQALWVAALEAVARLAAAREPAWAHELAERAAWARSSFRAVFWDEERGWLCDVVDGQRRDLTLRPNQLYALGLTAPLIAADEAARVLAVCERELLTPVGLRSRARDEGYLGHYAGDQHARDGAYHQGTVWPYLLGIYADACVRVRGAVPPGLYDGLKAHLAGEGLGNLHEIFDGDAPHAARGCVAQAWSVAEALRVARGDVGRDP